MNREQNRGIGQQETGQPFQENDVTVIGKNTCSNSVPRTKNAVMRWRSKPVTSSATSPMAATSARDVEGVGDQQKQHDAGITMGEMHS